MIVAAVAVWAIFTNHPWVATVLLVHLFVRLAIILADSSWNNLRPPDEGRPPGPIIPASPGGGEVDPLSLEWEQLQVMARAERDASLVDDDD